MQDKSSEIKAEPRRWFRFYAESVNDPKVQRLPAHLFKTWVNLLCLASANGGTLPNREDIAFQLRMSDHDANSHIDELIGLGLIDIAAGKSLEPHNWKARQYVSDTSKERTRRWRDKLKQPRDVTVTRPDTEQIQIQITDTEPEKTRDVRADDAPKRLRSQGSRLSNDFELPEDWRQWAKVNCLASDAQIDTEAANFADYWIAKPSQATSLDWKRTWQKWARKSFSPAGNRRPQSTGTYGASPEKHQVEGISAMIARLKSEGAIQ